MGPPGALLPERQSVDAPARLGLSAGNGLRDGFEGDPLVRNCGDGRIFGEDTVAAAMIDGLVHQADEPT